MGSSQSYSLSNQQTKNYEQFKEKIDNKKSYLVKTVAIITIISLAVFITIASITLIGLGTSFIVEKFLIKIFPTNLSILLSVINFMNKNGYILLLTIGQLGFITTGIGTSAFASTIAINKHKKKNPTKLVTEKKDNINDPNLSDINDTVLKNDEEPIIKEPVASFQPFTLNFIRRKSTTF